MFLINLIIKPIILGIVWSIFLCTMITGIYFFFKYILKIDLFKSLR